MIHELKILPLYFEAVARREKTFEIRVNDRNFNVGDTLLLKEWEHGNYTGREISRYVNYIYYGDGTFGIPDGIVIMNLKLSGTKVTLDTPQTDSTRIECYDGCEWPVGSPQCEGCDRLPPQTDCPWK